MRLTLKKLGDIHLEYKRVVSSAYYTFMSTSQVLANLIEVHELDSRHIVFALLHVWYAHRNSNACYHQSYISRCILYSPVTRNHSVTFLQHRVQCDGVSLFSTPDRIRTCDRLLRRQMLYPTELRDLKVGVAGFEPATSASQTRRDNRATLHPEMAERQGFEPWRRLHVDRLAICSITTLAPLQY